MLGPLLFVNKILEKSFSQRKLITERKFEKCCEAKKMHEGHITGRRKNVQPEKNQN